MTDKKSEIFKTAREVFFEKGYKETNISEIAKKAGIGIGTFYNYYPSKEELFLEVYIKENEELKKRIFDSVDFNDEPEVFVSKLLSKNISEMNSNAILREWYNKELFSKLEQYFKEQNGVKSIEEMMNAGMIELIRKWQHDGTIRNDIDEKMIAAIFKSIPYIDFHKEDIGIGYFPEIMIQISNLIMKGLKKI